jgi:cell division protein FtsN
MRCSLAIESIHRYLDNDLSEEEVSDMLGHISGCQECAEAFRTLKALTQELAELPLVVPKYSLVDAIMPQLDALDRARLEEVASEERQSAEMIPVTHINDRKKRVFTTSVTRMMIGVAAAVGILGIAIYNYSPQQLSDAQVQYNEQATTSAESNATGEAKSMKTGAGYGDANDSGAVADEEKSSSPMMKEEDDSQLLDSTPVEQETSPTSPEKSEMQKNTETDKSSAQLKSDKQVVSPDSPSLKKENPSPAKSEEIQETTTQDLNPSADVMMTQTESPDSLDSTVEADTPVDKQASELSEESTIDPVPNNKRIMSAITGFSSEAATLSDEKSVALSLDSPDGTMSVVVEKQKLVVYRLPVGRESEKVAIQSIELVGTWVIGEWALDSTVFTYQLDLNGKVSVYTYPIHAATVTTP